MNLRKVWFPLAFVVALCVGGEAQVEPARDATAGVIKETTFLPDEKKETGGDSGTPIDVGAYAEGVIYIDITDPTATSNVHAWINIVFESCSSPAPADCSTHTSTRPPIMTVGMQKWLVPVNNFGRYVRIKYTNAGSNAFSVKGTFKGYR